MKNNKSGLSQISTFVIIAILVVLAVATSIYFYSQGPQIEIIGPDSNNQTSSASISYSQLNTEIMANIIKNWSEIQKTISEKPTLGSKSWGTPQSFQFIGNDRLLAEFEDGHIALVAVFDYKDPKKPILIKTLENYPFLKANWDKIVKEYGNSLSSIHTYTKSIVRGKNIITFSDLTEVTENIFVKDYQTTPSTTTVKTEETNIITDEKGNLTAFKVAIALLDTANIYEGKRVACDTVYMKELKTVPTTQTLNDALKQLFALKDEYVDGLFNMVARVNKTLKFDRAEIENGVAKIYLTGSFPDTPYLGGICDDPRLKTQIDETALQFPAVQSVEIYLNGALIPWQKMWSQKGE